MRKMSVPVDVWDPDTYESLTDLRGELRDRIFDAVTLEERDAAERELMIVEAEIASGQTTRIPF